MLRFRQFIGLGASLEEEVNRWMHAEEPDIRNMTQCHLTGDSIVMSFIYDEGFSAQERRISREHGLARAQPPAPSPEERQDIPIPVDPGR